MSNDIDLMTQLLESIPSVVYMVVFFTGVIDGFLIKSLLNFFNFVTRYLKIKLSQIKEKKQ